MQVPFSLVSPVATKAVAIAASATLVGGAAMAPASPAEPATPETVLMVPAADEADQAAESPELAEPADAIVEAPLDQEAGDEVEEAEEAVESDETDEPDEDEGEGEDERSQVAVAVLQAIEAGEDVSAAARAANGSAERSAEARGRPDDGPAAAADGRARAEEARTRRDAEAAPDRRVDAPPAHAGRPEAR